VVSDPSSRRPLKTRGKAWAMALAGLLARRRVPPNLISVLSVAFAAGGAAALVVLPLAGGRGWSIALALAAAAGVQLRLLANMLDGMVAVEGGLRSPVGDLYNEIPDRFADLLLLAAAGYAAATSPWPLPVATGWCAAALALTTAYVRALGASLGTPHFFHGPMAKPHRMFLLTLACIAAAILPGRAGEIFHLALAAMIPGMLITLWRRIARCARHLRAADRGDGG